MNCINKSTAEFKNLLGETGISPDMLAIKISYWQFKNGLDSFPTFEDIMGYNPKALTSFSQNSKLQYIGSVQEYSDYSKTTNQPTEEGFRDYVQDKATSHDTEDLKDPFRKLKESKDTVDWSLIEGLEETPLEHDTYTENKINDEFDNLIFGGKKTSGSVKNVLSNITNTLATYSNEEVVDLVKKIQVFSDSNTVIKVDSNRDFGDSVAQWDSATNTIYLNKDKLRHTSVEEVLIAITHELAHTTTVSKLKNPKTESDKSFKSAVTEVFDAHSQKSESYGFSSVEEFVAEIYSNPEFRSELKEMMSNEKEVSLFDKFLNALRRLLGLSKKSEYETLVDLIVDNTEENIVKNTQEDYGIFNKGFFKKPNLTSSDEYLKHISNVVLDSVNNQLQTLKNTRKSARSLSPHYKKDVKALNEFKKMFATYDDIETIKALSAYTDFITEKTRILRSSVVKRDGQINKSQYDLKLIRAMESLLNDYTLKDTMYKYAIKLSRDIDVANDPELAKIVKGVLKSVKSIESMREEIDRRLLERKKELAVEFMANPIYATKVAKQLKDKYIADYRANKPAGYSEMEYVSQMFQANQAEYQKLLEESVHRMIENTYDDVGNLSRNFNDSLSINSPLIRTTMNMIFDFRARVMEEFRKKEAYLGKIHKAFDKGRPSAISKKYAPLYTKDKDGNFYLRNKYKAEVLDAYNEMLDDAKAEIYGENTAFEITNNEKRKITGLGKYALFRDDTEGISENDTVNLQKDKKYTKLNANVNGVHTFENINKDTEVDDIVRKYTEFDNLEELEASKQYVNEKSDGSKLNPALYNYLKNGKDLVVFEISEINETNKKSYVSTKAYKAFKEKYYDFTPDPNNPSNIFAGKYSIKDIYQDPAYNALTTAEKDVIEEFTKISNTANRIYKNKKTLITSFADAQFHKIPSKRKTTLERRLELDAKGIFKDSTKDFVERRTDDVYEGLPLDGKGTELTGLRIYNRDKLAHEDQSLELFDIYRDEYERSLNYAEREELELKLNAVKDIAASKSYSKKSLITGGNVLNSRNKNSPLQEFEGRDSNEYKKILGIIETNLYDITLHHSDNLFGLQTNKVVGAISGAAASAALTFNVAAGIANIFNGVTQLKIDAIGGHHFSFSDLTKAEGNYMKDLPNILADLSSPVKTSKTNAMLQMFDFLGGSTKSQQEFLRDSLAKKLATTKQANVMNEVGENFMSAIVTEAILRGITVMNADGRMINKEGVVVSDKKDAANMYDMLEFDSNTGVLQINDKVVYTSFTPEVKIDEGGKSHIDMLIKKKAADMYGMYDSNLSAELQKNIAGKALFMFKKFFIPGMNYRYKNAKTMMRTREEMREDEKTYNTALKEYEEGYYITFGRMMVQAVKNFNELGLAFIPQYYNQLSDYEKANIKKTLYELVITHVMLPVIALALGAAYDDDDEKPYAMLYQVARLQSELRQFYSPLDLLKMTSNPIAGMNIVNKSLTLLGEISTPIKLFPEDDESHFDWLNTNRNGENKLWRSTKSVIPMLSQTNKSWKDLYNYLK